MSTQKRPAIADLLDDVRQVVDDFEAGLIGPTDVPVSMIRSEGSERLDEIEHAVFLADANTVMGPEDRAAFRRQWGAFRLARYFGSDCVSDVLWAMRHSLAGVLLDTSDGLRLQVLLELLDPVRGVPEVVH